MHNEAFKCSCGYWVSTPINDSCLQLLCSKRLCWQINTSILNLKIIHFESQTLRCWNNYDSLSSLAWEDKSTKIHLWLLFQLLLSHHFYCCICSSKCKHSSHLWKHDSEYKCTNCNTKFHKVDIYIYKRKSWWVNLCIKKYCSQVCVGVHV